MQTASSFSPQPLSVEQQQQVVAMTQHYIDQAQQLLRFKDIPVDIRFDLRGRAAGMYTHRDGQRTIRFNPWLFANFYDDNLQNTVPHEVAHYLCDVIYGLRCVRPHGKEWRTIMSLLGAEPSTRHHYDLQGVPVRRHRRITYRCGCRQHTLSLQRHRRIQSGLGYYQCRHCGKKLIQETSHLSVVE